MEIEQLRKEFEEVEIGSEGYHTWGMSYWQAEQCASITIEHMKGFSEWLQENRWFTFDSQKQRWHYTFEHGTSMGEATYLKNYTKTTEELVSLYFESLIK